MVPGKVCFGEVPLALAAAGTATLGCSLCSGGESLFSSRDSSSCSGSVPSRDSETGKAGEGGRETGLGFDACPATLQEQNYSWVPPEVTAQPQLFCDTPDSWSSAGSRGFG